MGLIKISKSKLCDRLYFTGKVLAYSLYFLAYIGIGYLIYNFVTFDFEHGFEGDRTISGLVFVTFFFGGMIGVGIGFTESIMQKDSPLNRLNSKLNLFEWTNGIKKEVKA